VAELLKKKFMPPMLFYGGNLLWIMQRFNAAIRVS
jgi:hypothetical protein